MCFVSCAHISQSGELDAVDWSSAVPGLLAAGGQFSLLKLPARFFTHAYKFKFQTGSSYLHLRAHFAQTFHGLAGPQLRTSSLESLNQTALHHFQMLTLVSTFKESTVLCSSHRGL